MTNFWWVNQRRTAYDAEKRLGLIWAPITDTQGRRLSHWERMDEVTPDDVILHYNDGRIVAVSRALTRALRAQNPTNDPRWQTDGRMIRVEMDELDVPVVKEAIQLSVRLQFSGPSHPFTKTGNVKQGYFLQIPVDLAATIAREGGFLADESEGPAVLEVGDTRAAGPTISVTADGRSLATYRPEQGQLARSLFQGRASTTCAFCGRDLPVGLLVAAHIKPRHIATLRERADYNIVVPTCTLGCDALFEHGYVVVSDEGAIQIGRHPSTPALKTALEELTGRRVEGFSELNAAYFRWHKGAHTAAR